MAFTDVCGSCRTRFAAGLLRCPRCRAVAPRYADRVKEEEMPRITVASGPSNAGAAPGEVGYIAPAEPEAPEVAAEAVPEVLDEPGPEPDPAPADWASKTVGQLRKAAGERGLDTAGPKADLAARLAEHDAAQDTVEPEGPAAEATA